jgi:sterol desaturase/sphingolipid hydroxylase (fatty acid hydroxylase superfamily)
MFYFTHRSLHMSWIYPSIHKIHHENQVTYCLAAIHTHPLEYIVGNILPLMIGPALLNVRMHRAAMFGWYAVRGLESIDAHSGYSFSWSPFRLLPC